MEFMCEKKVLGYLAGIKPSAVAMVKGSRDYPNIKGTVTFYQQSWGVYVVHSIGGLPEGEKVFAFHIHNGSSCTGNDSDPFANAGSHYNPKGAEHPYHAGDLPPLFSSDGYAWGAVLVDRFKVKDVIGLPIIVHSGVDDFTTQPSGNAGSKIACGIIKEV